MSRKPFPWKDSDERARYLKLYKRLAKGTSFDSLSSEDQDFYKSIRERIDASGVKMKDPSTSQESAHSAFSTATDSAQASPAGDGGALSPDAPTPEKPKEKKKRAPLDIKIPPDKLAKAIMAGTLAIEISNRQAGYPGMPDVWFPVAEQLLCDYLEELAARGWDLRKLRGVVLGGGFAVTGVQGIRRKVAESKKKKMEAGEVGPVQTATPSNGHTPTVEPQDERPPHAKKSTVGGDAL